MNTRHIELSDIDEPGPWWIACEHPERRVDDWTVWSWDCDACVIHLIAAAVRDGDHPAVAHDPHDHAGDDDSTAGTLVRARAWRAGLGLRPL